MVLTIGGMDVGEYWLKNIAGNLDVPYLKKAIDENRISQKEGF